MAAHPRAPGGGPLYWSDLVVVFVLYTVGFLVTGLLLGGDEARDVAATNVGALVAAGLGLGARLVWRGVPVLIPA